MKFYHGTNADNLKSILKFGFNAVKANKQVWECSDYNNYFWNPRAVLASNEVETEEDALEFSKREAFSSAEMSLSKAKDCRRVVFEVDLPKEMVEPDTSCDNMYYAVMTEEKVDPKYIVRYWIDSEDLSYFKAYFGSLIIDMDLACEVTFKPAEMVIIKALQKTETCEIFEALEDLRHEAIEISVNELTAC